MSTPKGTIPWNKGKGTGWTDKRGYVWFYVTEGGKRVARRAHRVVMEKHLGRRLDPWELVHHKDGNTKNNDISNLEIKDWGIHTVDHHKGLRHAEDSRRSMEAFALMRQELMRERQVKADLLAALKNICVALEDSDSGAYTTLANARAAITKAEGRA